MVTGTRASGQQARTDQWTTSEAWMGTAQRGGESTAKETDMGDERHRLALILHHSHGHGECCSAV